MPIKTMSEIEWTSIMSCETAAHLESIVNFHLANLQTAIIKATSIDNGWPVSMAIEFRELLGSRNSWTPKKAVLASIPIKVRQLTNAARILEEFLRRKSSETTQEIPRVKKESALMNGGGI